MLTMTAMLRLVKCLLTVWRFKTMVKQTMNMAKGIGMGVLAGVAVAAVSSKMMRMGATEKPAICARAPAKPCTPWGRLSAMWRRCSADAGSGQAAQAADVLFRPALL